MKEILNLLKSENRDDIILGLRILHEEFSEERVEILASLRRSKDVASIFLSNYHIHGDIFFYIENTGYILYYTGLVVNDFIKPYHGILDYLYDRSQKPIKF